jgi:hypothetical protein
MSAVRSQRTRRGCRSGAAGTALIDPMAPSGNSDTAWLRSQRDGAEKAPHSACQRSARGASRAVLLGIRVHQRLNLIRWLNAMLGRSTSHQSTYAAAMLRATIAANQNVSLRAERPVRRKATLKAAPVIGLWMR